MKLKQNRSTENSPGSVPDIVEDPGYESKKKEQIRQELLEDPEKANKKIAEEIGCRNEYVSEVRSDMRLKFSDIWKRYRRKRLKQQNGGDN